METESPKQEEEDFNIPTNTDEIEKPKDQR